MIKHRWRKSSRSHQNGECVEVSVTLDEIRDSKDPYGPTLRLDALAFSAFVRAIKNGRFDH